MANQEKGKQDYQPDGIDRKGFVSAYQEHIKQFYDRDSIILQSSLAFLEQSQNQIVAESAKIVRASNIFEFNDTELRQCKFSVELATDNFTPYTALSLYVKEEDKSNPLGNKLLYSGLHVYHTRQEIDSLSDEALSNLIRPDLARTAVL